MNIEDVKHMTDEHLNIQLSKIIGHTENIAKAVYYGNIRKYTENIILAREAQAKAIAVNANKYVGTLYDVMYFDEGVPPDPTDNFQEVTYRGTGVAYMLQASSRQIAEAAYITLMEVTSQ